MASTLPKPAAPSQDKRWRIIDATMRRLGNQGRGLIEALHNVQETFGYIDDPSLNYVARSLHVPLSRAYGVATFYHYFTMKPPGKHSCIVCLGTACHIKGASQLMATAQRDLSIEDGETTPDGNASLLSAHCIGSCGLAPAVVLDGEITGKVTPEKLHNNLAQWTSK